MTPTPKHEILRAIFPRLRALASAQEAAWIAGHASTLEDALAIVARREKGEPLAYIFGAWPFLEREYKIGPGVLIPRPETEELADLVVRECRRSFMKTVVEGRRYAIADFGAGSGCLGLGVALGLGAGAPKLGEESDSPRVLPNAAAALELTLIERSPEALPWLRENVAAHARELPGAKIEVFEGSWADWPTQPLDLVLANPPYVTETEFTGVEASVKNHEPRSALVPDDESRNWDASGPYHEILGIAAGMLRPGGRLYFELGAAQAPWMLDYVARLGFFANAVILKDMSDKPRFLRADRKA